MEERWDVVIIGGGPSGLSSAVYAGRARLKTLILEKMMLGGQVALTDDIANYPGFPDGISGQGLTELMKKQAEKFGAVIRLEGVENVEVDGKLKVVTTSKGNRYVSPVLIVASGADPRKLGCAGEDEFRGRGVSYCATCDGPFFKDKVCAVIGGGDAAFKESLFLTKFASRLMLVHRRQGFRAEKIHVEQAKANPKIELVLDTIVKSIYGSDRVEGIEVENVKTNEVGKLECQGVFIFIGHVPNTDVVSGLLKIDERGHISVNSDMETDVEGVYAVGDVRAGSYRQIATGVGEAVTAAMHAETRVEDYRRDGVWS